MVMAYNVPELGEAGPSIMMDGDVLAAIWSGNITKWNDEAIKQLNPGLSLPDRNITVGYGDDCRTTSSCDTLKHALQSFSPAFAAEFSARGRLLANMRFAAEGRGRELSGESRDRAAWLRAEPYGLAFLDHADALNAGYPVRSMAMFNRAGTLVEPSAGSVGLAMRDVNDAYAAGNLTSDFHDPPGYGSWPLTHVLFATVANSLEEVGSSLSINGKDRQADCTGDFARVDPTPAVHSRIGHWATFRTVSTLADHWKLPTEVVGSCTGDFRVSDESWRYDQTPDLAVMPTVAFSLVPAANLPTLRGLRLVLDFPTIAAIYLGEITNWSDSRIRALNDDAVCAELPDAEIHVVVDDVESEANELLTGLLSAKVPAFASAVGVSSHPTFPVMASNATLRSDSPSGVIKHLTDTTHSFAVWYGYDLGHIPGASKHQRRISPVQAAGIKSDEGAIVFADSATIGAALDERVESQSAPQRGEATMLDVSGPWPMTVVSSVLYPQSTMKDCSQATALADFLHWVLTDPLAESQAQTEDMVPASSNAKLKRLGLNQLTHFTCEGAPVIAIAIAKRDHQSELDHETSEQGWTISTILGTIMEIIFAILVITVVGIVIFTLRLRQLFTRNRGRAMNTRRLEIDLSTIQLGDALDVGFHGCVWHAKWQERKVVVKTMGGAHPSARLVKTFNKEISAIASMRHPDLAGLLGVCTDPSRPLSIVREYMPLMSLYDVLHNKRPLPARFRLQMAFEIARGMHFLHSSGIYLPTSFT
jgi:ABC-type phosphate transport system substrate-binding protein